MSVSRDSRRTIDVLKSTPEDQTWERLVGFASCQPRPVNCPSFCLIAKNASPAA